MPRLPIPGSDSGQWGDILNNYLSQSHTSDGKLKTDSVTASQLAPGSVKAAAIADSTITTTKLADGTVTTSKLADSAITNAKLDAPTKASLAKADAAVQDSDPRLSDARTPSAHAASHASAGSDPVTIAQSQVTNLTTDLAGKAPTLHDHPASAISDSTTVGRSLLTATDVAAAQSALSLSSTYDTKAQLAVRLRDGRSAPGHKSGTDHLAAFRDFGIGTCTVAFASDSTGNDGNDWFRIFTKDYGTTLPSTIRRVYRRWDNAAGAYVEEVDAAGTVVPASGGVCITDTFTRVAAELVGSTSDDGKVWAGTAGKWSADGSAAVVGGAGGPLSYNTGSRDSTLTANLKLVTTGTGTSQSWRFHVGSTLTTLSGGTSVWGAVSVSAAGTASLSLFKTIAGVSTALTSAPPSGITNNSATVQDVTVEMSVAAQQVTLTITVGVNAPVVASGTITESNYVALGTNTGINGFTPSPGFKMDAVAIETPATPEQGVDGLIVLNAAVAGATLALQQAILSTLFPAENPIDVLGIAPGHNYGSDTPAVFLPKVADFISAFATLHPETCIVISSQNPQKAPAATVTAHALRQLALRTWAGEQGYEYVPAFEAFVAQSDGGVSLLTAEGVHPTTPPSGDLTVWSGARLWADLALAVIDARSYVIQ